MSNFSSRPPCHYHSMCVCHLSLLPWPTSPSPCWAAGGGFNSSDERGPSEDPLLPPPCPEAYLVLRLDSDAKRTNYSLSRLSRAQLCPSGGFFALLLPLSKSDIYQNDPHTYHSVGCHLLHHCALSFMFMRKGELLTPAVSHSP